MLVIVCGLPSTGKSTVAKQIAEDTKGKILRTDVIRKELFKKATLEDVENAENPMLYNLEGVFDAQETIPDRYQEMIWQQKKMVYDELFHRIAAMLKEGETVILDGTFYERSLRERIYTIAKENNTRIYLVECVCSENFVRERLEKRRSIADDASYVDKFQVYLKVKKAYESPTSDSTGEAVPIIRYDTGLQKIEIHNSEHENKKELDMIVRSLRKIAGRFSGTSSHTRR